MRELYYNERANQMALSHLGAQFTYFTGAKCTNTDGAAAVRELVGLREPRAVAARIKSLQVALKEA